MTADRSLEVAFVIGGHPFDARAVTDALVAQDGIAWYPQDLPTFVDDGWTAPTDYDAVAFYNFHGNGYGVELTDEMAAQTRDLIPRLGEAGVGIVPLHHGLLAFPELQAWTQVTGLHDRTVEVAHDQRLPIEVADPDHPIAVGLESWTVTDEAYDMADPVGDTTAVLRTDHPRSMDTIAWTRRYRNARVFCYQSGHDGSTVSTDGFRTVLGRGVRWAAKAEGTDGSVA